MSHIEHKKSAPRRVAFAVVTVSDTRREKEDISDDIRSVVGDLLASDEVDLIVLTGGSGIAPRDVTVEALAPLIDKKIDGFGELFRYLSYLEIGSPAILSRSMAGVASGKIIVAIPGSERAVRLAMERLILPEAGHMVMEGNK
jgi:molybdenum cofactor biosynthesis protein B